MSRANAPHSTKLANPSVVGISGFGLSTLVLRLCNVGWMSNGPVIWLGLIFGGLVQLTDVILPDHSYRCQLVPDRMDALHCEPLDRFDARSWRDGDHLYAPV